MRFKTNLKVTPNLIDLTPLVDVIFLMLIFFIVTSDILPLKSLNIENPTLEADSMPLTTQLLVVMDAQNVIYVGSKKEILDFATLESHLRQEIAKLKAKHPTTIPTVVLSVDRKVEYGLFLQLFAIVQECAPRMRLVYRSSLDL
ncbi:MAG: biopolymer transporter ExbD [Parachlamydiaceae bacterium]|nr:biopolymer transporter ExbD [Parachlamydiaceae bacterium]